MSHLQDTLMSGVAHAPIMLSYMMMFVARRGVPQYKVTRSLRFNAADLAKLQRVGTMSTINTITVSAWVKGLNNTTDAVPILADPDQSANNTRNILGFTGNQMFIQCMNSSGTITTDVRSGDAFRDPNAWYHCVWVFDGGNSTAADKQIFYVNGVRLTNVTGTRGTAFHNNFPSSSANMAIGVWQANGTDRYANILIAEMHVIDGVAEASDFGETDPITGAWIPKKVTISYGTGGFYLDFSDNSSAAALGTDRSGNGFDFTPTNLSVTAGSGNDSLVDSPTNYGSDTGVGGQVRGNYANLNLLNMYVENNLTLSNGNLDVKKTTASTQEAVSGSFVLTTEKMYWEVEISAVSGNGFIGVYDGRPLVGTSSYSGLNVHWAAANGIRDGDNTVLNSTSWDDSDILGFALDGSADTLACYKNGTLIYTVTSLRSKANLSTNSPLCPILFTGGSSNSITASFNFGQRPFSNAPSGFKVQCTQSLSDPLIKEPNKYFDVVTHTGTGASQDLTVDFQPDLAWIKRRDDSASNHLIDSVRGVSATIFSDSTSAELSRPNGLTSFNTNGVTLGTSSDSNTNVNGNTYVDWFWKRGVTPGFDIVTYTGDGASNRTIAHGLGVAPNFVIVKNLDSAQDWPVWHKPVGGSSSTLWLDLTNSIATTRFYDAGMTSTTFGVTATGDSSNGLGDSLIAYLWAEVPGFSKFGSYTGNNNAEGPFVWCGFAPRYLLIKRTSAIGSWYILDTERNVWNPTDLALLAEKSNGESTITAPAIDFLSNGFKIRSTIADINSSAGSFIFAAFAAYPLKYTRGY